MRCAAPLRRLSLWQTPTLRTSSEPYPSPTNHQHGPTSTRKVQRRELYARTELCSQSQARTQRCAGGTHGLAPRGTWSDTCADAEAHHRSCSQSAGDGTAGAWADHPKSGSPAFFRHSYVPPTLPLLCSLTLEPVAARSTVGLYWGLRPRPSAPHPTHLCTPLISATSSLIDISQRGAISSLQIT